jgi:hypothetical protein
MILYIYRERECVRVARRGVQVAGFCEHGNEHPCSIKCEEILDILSDWQFLKKASASKRWFVTLEEFIDSLAWYRLP